MNTHTKVHPARLVRLARQLVVVSCSLVALAGCAESCPQPQVVVVNSTPPADSGQTVLLTVMICVAFLAAAAAVALAWRVGKERSGRHEAERARRSAEDRLLVVRERASGRARYDLPEGDLPSVWVNETPRAPAGDLRRPAIERGRA